ncbi:ADAMTS-like protein 1 isoform X1 [Tachysurus ichikawai]
MWLHISIRGKGLNAVMATFVRLAPCKVWVSASDGEAVFIREFTLRHRDDLPDDFLNEGPVSHKSEDSSTRSIIKHHLAYHENFNGSKHGSIHLALKQGLLHGYENSEEEQMGKAYDAHAGEGLTSV